ncbi:MAG: SCO family protein [Bacteroidetes bacterium]|nr:SCO family protein [Bacteroidota bacterium]
MVLNHPRIVCRLSGKLGLFAWFFLALNGCGLLDVTEKKLPFFITKDLSPQWNIQPTHQVASFSFVDQSGNTICSDSLRKGIYLVNFFFTSCPGICPKMTNRLLSIQDSLLRLKGVTLLSFSVMPMVDSVPVLKQYEKKYGIHPEIWHLLTGDKAAIYRLGRSSFFADDNTQGDTSTFLHSDKLFLVDRERHIRGVYNATREEDMQRVLADVNQLKKED